MSGWHTVKCLPKAAKLSLLQTQAINHSKDGSLISLRQSDKPQNDTPTLRHFCCSSSSSDPLARDRRTSAYHNKLPLALHLNGPWNGNENSHFLAMKKFLLFEVIKRIKHRYLMKFHPIDLITYWWHGKWTHDNSPRIYSISCRFFTMVVGLYTNLIFWEDALSNIATDQKWTFAGMTQSLSKLDKIMEKCDEIYATIYKDKHPVIVCQVMAQQKRGKKALLLAVNRCKLSYQRVRNKNALNHCWTSLLTRNIDLKTPSNKFQDKLINDPSPWTRDN